MRGSCQWLGTGKRQFPPALLLTSCTSQMLLAINITRWLASRSGHLTVRARPGWRPNQLRGMRGSCQWLKTGKRQFPPALLLTSCTSQMLLAINITRWLASQSGHITVRARIRHEACEEVASDLELAKGNFHPLLYLPVAHLKCCSQSISLASCSLRSPLSLTGGQSLNRLNIPHMMTINKLANFQRPKSLVHITFVRIKIIDLNWESTNERKIFSVFNAKPATSSVNMGFVFRHFSAILQSSHVRGDGTGKHPISLRPLHISIIKTHLYTMKAISTCIENSITTTFRHLNLRESMTFAYF